MISIKFSDYHQELFMHYAVNVEVKVTKWVPIES